MSIYRSDEPIKTLQPGDFLDNTLLEPGTSAIAKTNCRLVPVDEKIMAVLKQYPLDFRVAAIQVMVERLTWRVSPPVQLIVRPLPQPGTRTSVKTRHPSDTFTIAIV